MSLRSFITEMKKKKQVVQVEDPVSPRFEIPAFMKEFDGGPILHFNNVKGTNTKVVAGICGTRQRLCWAVGVTQEGLYTRATEAC